MRLFEAIQSSVYAICQKLKFLIQKLNIKRKQFSFFHSRSFFLFFFDVTKKKMYPETASALQCSTRVREACEVLAVFTASAARTDRRDASTRGGEGARGSGSRCCHLTDRDATGPAGTWRRARNRNHRHNARRRAASCLYPRYGNTTNFKVYLLA